MVHKSLIEMIKICSVLPALAIMPAMANTKVIDVKEDLTIEEGKTYTDGMPAIANYNKLTFSSDETVIFENNIQGYRGYGPNASVEFNGLAVFQNNKQADVQNTPLAANTKNMIQGPALMLYNDQGSNGYGENLKATFNRGLQVLNNTGLYSGAVENRANIAVHGDVLFSGNAALGSTAHGSMSGGGGALSNGTYATFAVDNAENIVFENNSALGGGAINNGGTVSLEAKNVTFKGNSSSASYGGAVFTGAGSNFSVLGDVNTFDDNHDNETRSVTQSGGGVIQARGDNNGAAVVVIGKENSKNTFSNNSASINGGAIVNRNTAEMTINGDTIFNKNVAQKGHGGAIYNFGQKDDTGAESPTLTFNGDVGFANNTANRGNGGAIWNGTDGTSGVTATVVFNDDASFIGNVATATSGQGHREGHGGAIYNNGTMTLKDDALFANNEAYMGAAIYNDVNGVLTLADATFTGNIVEKTGTINNQGTLTINGHASFSNNTQTGTSGNSAGIHNGTDYSDPSKNIAATLTIDAGSNSTINFSNNTARQSAAIYNAAGTVTLRANDISFSYNKSTATYGGAIMNTAYLNILGAQNRFIGNQDNEDKNATQSGGGAIHNRGTNLYAANTAIGENGSVNLFSKNIALVNGGAIVNRNRAAMKIAGTQTTFEQNTAKTGNGGAIYNYGQKDDTGLESPIFMFFGAVDFNNNSALAGNGGAIWNGTDGSGATAEITFNSGSSFTGNTAAEGLGGAIYNGADGVITFANNASFARNTAGGKRNDIHNLGILNIKGGQTSITGGITGTGDMVVFKNAALSIGTSTIEQGDITIDGTLYTQITDKAYGKIIADNEIAGAGRVVINDARAGTYDIFNKDNDLKVDAGFLFKTENNGAAGVVISQRTADDIAADTGLSVQASALAAAMANTSNRQFNNRYKQMLVQIEAFGDLSENELYYYNEEAGRANPYDKPMLHSMTTSLSNQVLDLATGRMAGGRAGGDMTVGYGAWVQGMHNKSKFSDNFSASTGGLAFGFDTLINRKYTLGIGYANNSTDIDAHNRDVEVSAHTLFAYAQYKPNKWFLNATAQYSMADYDEDTTVMGVPLSASYDVDSYGAQVMTGYDFATGLTPSMGVRYLHMTQDDYSNDLLHISGADADFATAVAGLRFAFDIQSDTSVKWSPNLYANATYDFLSDDVYSTVVLPGVANYRVRGDRLSRMGGEFGIGLNAKFNRTVISLNYELDLHKDYTSQTGMLKLKYNF